MKSEFLIPKMACENCFKTIKNVLSKLTGVSSIEADITQKKIFVDYDEKLTNFSEISQKLTKIGFPPQN